MGRVFYLFFSPLNTRESEGERETETEREASILLRERERESRRNQCRENIHFSQIAVQSDQRELQQGNVY